MNKIQMLYSHCNKNKTGILANQPTNKKAAFVVTTE